LARGPSRHALHGGLYDAPLFFTNRAETAGLADELSQKERGRATAHICCWWVARLEPELTEIVTSWGLKLVEWIEQVKLCYYYSCHFMGDPHYGMNAACIQVKRIFTHNVKGSFTMRKFISLGLFALVLTSLSAQLSAGHFEDCEGSKTIFQELGVYGLCNAWHNAETDEERAKFTILFENKAGYPPPWMADCPCFSVTDLALAYGLRPANCVSSATNVSVSYADPAGGFLIYTAYDEPFYKACFLSNTASQLLPEGNSVFSIKPEQVDECFALLEGAILADFSEEDFPAGCDD
jgi:hypothetical protein